MDINENESEIKTEENVIENGNETNNNFLPFKEMTKSAIADVESTQSDGSKGKDETGAESREDRIRRVKDRSEAERQRKLAEIIEAQKQSQQFRLKQQMERRKRIDELKQREEERRRAVELRKKELDEKEKEKSETLLKRTKEREARAALSQKSLRSSLMTQSMISPRQTTTSMQMMTSSIHSSGGASSSSDKCTRRKPGYGYGYGCGYSFGLHSASGGGRWSRSIDQSPSPNTAAVAGAVSMARSNSAGNHYRHQQQPRSHRWQRHQSPPSPMATNTANRRPRAPAAAPGPGTHWGGPCTHKTGSKQPPEGFIEVDGHFIPAKTRHVGCFLPYRGDPLATRVRGVLVWRQPVSARDSLDNRVSTSVGPSTATATSSSGSKAWWAPIDRSSTCTGTHRSRGLLRARSATGTGNKTGSVATVSVASSIVSNAHSHRPNSSSNGNDNKDGGHVDCKEPMSSLSKNRSASRPNVPATVSASTKSRQVAVATATTSAKPKDDAFFDRLSRPRSGSQPPKPISRDQAESAPKVMTTSTVSKQPVKQDKAPSKGKPKKVAPPVASVEPTNEIRGSSEEPVAPEIVVQSPREPDHTETSNTATEEPSSINKSSSRRGSKNLTKNGDNLEPVSAAGLVDEEAAYKMKLTEQRRLAREKKEEQMEEQRRIEEEARQKVLLEKKRIEEETRQVIEEEARRAQQEEDERLAELEKQKFLEDAERKKKEDAEREKEEKLQEKLRLNEEARMDRKRRLEKIMKRVKKPDEPSTSQDENTTITETMETSTNIDDKNESLMEISIEENCLQSIDDSMNHEDSPQPAAAWTTQDDELKRPLEDSGTEDVESKMTPEDSSQETNESRNSSPGMISDTVLNLTGPQSINAGNSQSAPIDSLPPIGSAGPGEEAPKFKSRLLQNMLGSGRLNANKTTQDDRSINTRPTSNYGMQKEKRNSCLISPNMIDSISITECVPHSKSYNADMNHIPVVANGVSCNQPINGLSHESQSIQTGTATVTNGNYNQNDTATLPNNNSSDEDVLIDPPVLLSADRSELQCDLSQWSQCSSDECPGAVPVPSSPPSPRHSQPPPLELS